jgi:hypothetical protein
MAAVALLLHATLARPVFAQSTACLRFTFGTWSPALNWKAAGHATVLDSLRIDRAPDGRAWAGPAGNAAGDTVLVLYPAFWPAGVALSFDARTLQPGDTATARATAFVADARVPSSVTSARVWRVPCH